MKKWIAIFFFCFFLIGCSNKNEPIKTPNFIGKSKEEVENIARQYYLNIVWIFEYHDKIKKGNVIKQTPESGTVIDENQITITISNGKSVDYQALGVNELGNVPIMMYHGIQNVESQYKNGNIDLEGYQRTSKAFQEDLEFYYQQGYRMIRLIDFVNGNIEVELGKSPIVLTFDDGKHNIKVTGIDEAGELIIDQNCAVGILENFKKKYPDFNVTATFFLNGGLFEDTKYNNKIIKWLLDHGYDIGNHSFNHVDFSKVDNKTASLEIGKMYSLLDSVTDNRYVPIVALPFGSPYHKEHDNFSSILNSVYEEKKYQTIATLRVGWEANISCFDRDFDATFLKRIRAYDNNGVDFDIKMNFEILNKSRFISDGNKDQITIPKELEENIRNIKLRVNTY